MLMSSAEGPIDLSGIEPSVRKSTAELLKEPPPTPTPPKDPWWMRLYRWAAHHQVAATAGAVALVVVVWYAILGVMLWMQGYRP